MKRKLCFMASPCLFRKPFLGSIGIAVGVIIFCLFFNTRAYPQMALSIGDKLPDVTVQNIIHHSTNEVKLSEYKGKLLILDFWAIWCSPCLTMFPKTDSLQKQFADQVQFLPVTYQSKEDVMKLWSKSKKLNGIALPIVTSDNILRNLFPHKELPHYVWIDQSGVVIAITGHHEVTAENIQKLLSNSKPILKEKHDMFKEYSREMPLLFQSLDIKKEQIIFQSMITSYAEGLQSRFDVISDEKGQITRITMVNAWLQMMFALAWSDETRYFTRNRIVLDVKDPLKVISHDEGEPFKKWLKDNSWCYEIILPPHLSSNAFQIMRSDLAKFFPHYVAGVEKRSRPCLALVRTSKIDKLKSKGGAANSSFDFYSVSMTNTRLTLLTSQLNHYLQNLSIPVIDGTGYSNPVDIKLDTNITSVEDLRKALKAYDLDLVEKEMEIEVLVIRDGTGI